MGSPFEITGVDKSPRALLAETAPARLAEAFALYLRQYPEARITFGGERVDPAALEEHAEDIERALIGSTVA